MWPGRLGWVGAGGPMGHVMGNALRMVGDVTFKFKLGLLGWRWWNSWQKLYLFSYSSRGMMLCLRRGRNFHFLKLRVEVPNFGRRVMLVVWQLVLAERSKSKSILAVTFWLQLWLGQLTHAVAKSREALEKLGADNWSLGATGHGR